MAYSRPTDEERLQFSHIDPRRRREDIRIRRMRESNPDVFAEICRRFVRGETVVSVATWLWRLKPRGYLSTCTYGTIRVYLIPLRARIRGSLRDRAEEIHLMPPPPVPAGTATPRQVVQAVNETLPTVETRQPHVTDELKLMVDKRVAEIRGIEMLKYIYYQQDCRLRRLLEMEAHGNGILTRKGTAAIDVMRKIAESICKVETADGLSSVKRLYRGINPVSAEAANPIPPSDKADDFIRRVESDSPGRDLMREAGTKFIDVMRMEFGAGFKASGLGSADAPTNDKRRELQRIVSQFSPEARQFFFDFYLPKLAEEVRKVEGSFR